MTATMFIMSDMQEKLFKNGGFDEGGALLGLSVLDPDVAHALNKYGPPPDRSLPASFETLARAIVGQQVSRVAASAIWKRMETDGITDEVIIATKTPDELMLSGLSRRKAEYLIGVASEITTGTLDLEALAQMPGETVQKRLVQIRGIGAWTADNYRLFALGDMDAWPGNDIALQEGMKRLKTMAYRPNLKEMNKLAEGWSPYRGAGALFLWHLYAAEVRTATPSDI